jgi:hypothetical protein
MTAGNKITILPRALHFSSAFALLFFLIASAPHRVHHFFEQVPLAEESQIAYRGTHDHGSGHDHNQKPAPASRENNCVVLSAAQHSYAAAVELYGIKTPDSITHYRQEPKLEKASVFNFSPCSQRAPPLV